MISIVVPVYNVHNLLEKCIFSILKQTYKLFEIILIDDGSTDGSGELCEYFAQQDSRIKVYHKKNGGVSSARNFGIEKAKMEFITFIDSDDFIEKNHIENFIKNIYLKQETTYDLIMQGIKHVSESGRCLKNQLNENLYTQEYIRIQNKEKVDERLFACPAFGWVTNKLYKLSIIKENCLRFPEDTYINEDRIFNIEYSQYVKSFIMLPSTTYNYVSTHYSLTRSFIHPNIFIVSANAFDRLLNSRKRSKYCSDYLCNFTVKFYTHAFGLCFVSSLKKINFTERIDILKRIFYYLKISTSAKVLGYKIYFLFIKNIFLYTTSFISRFKFIKNNI